MNWKKKRITFNDNLNFASAKGRKEWAKQSFNYPSLCLFSLISKRNFPFSLRSLWFIAFLLHRSFALHEEYSVKWYFSLFAFTALCTFQRLNSFNLCTFLIFPSSLALVVKTKPLEWLGMWTAGSKKRARLHFWEI